MSELSADHTPHHVNVPRAVREELQHEAEGLPVQIVSYVEDSVSAMAAADLIVCMAGYNTLAEVLHFQRGGRAR